MILKQVFNNNRIVGLIGNSHTGKTNNLIYLIKEFKKANRKAGVVVYGFNKESTDYLKKIGCETADSLEQLSLARNKLVCLDEFQRLNLSDKRYKQVSQEFFDFIFHNNNWLILSSPNLSEFNKMVCRRVDAWLVKELHVKDLVNGSKVKVVCNDYKGYVKSLGRFNVGKGELLFISSKTTELLTIPYIKAVDGKKANVDIFKVEKVKKKVREIKSKNKVKK